MKKRILMTILVVIILLITVSISYAYFSVIGTNTPQTISMSAGTMSLVFNDNDAGINKEMTFGESIVKKFTIANNGTRETYATMNFKNMINTYLDGSLIYTLEYSTEENGTYTKVVENRNVPVSRNRVNRVLAAGLEIPAGVTYYYKLTVTLVNSDTVDQTSDLDASFDTGFMIEEGHAPIKPKVINERGEKIENGVELLNTVGTKVAIGNENFYVIENKDNKVRLFAEYTLQSGNSHLELLDTSKPYYVVATREGSDQYIYTVMYSYEEIQRRIGDLNGSFTYIGKAEWNDETETCTYNDEEILIAAFYVLNPGTVWKASYSTCNSVYKLTIGDNSFYVTGVQVFNYNIGFQKKANIDLGMFTTTYMDDSIYELYYPNGFGQREDIYIHSNIKTLTDEYVNTLLKEYGVYTSSDYINKNDALNLFLALDNVTIEDDTFIQNIAATTNYWYNISQNETYVSIHYNKSFSQLQYNDTNAVGIRPVISLDISAFS